MRNFCLKFLKILGCFTTHFDLKYEIIYQLDAIEYLSKETVTSIAPEDGSISPKNVELKEHK